MSNLFPPEEVKAGPAPWIVMDVETQEGRPEEIKPMLIENWWPNENNKPDTNLRKLTELIAEKETKLALLDASPPGLVQIRTPTETLLLHPLFAEPAREFKGVPLIGFGTVRELLVFLRDWLDEHCDEGTLIVGWNIKGFDLKKIRSWYLREGLNLPKVLRVGQPVFDMMKEYLRHFYKDAKDDPKDEGAKGGVMLRLSVALRQLNIPSRKDQVNGSMVGAMIREKRFEDLFAYGLDDVNEETELFLTLTGKSERLQ